MVLMMMQQKVVLSLWMIGIDREGIIVDRVDSRRGRRRGVLRRIRVRIWNVDLVILVILLKFVIFVFFIQSFCYEIVFLVIVVGFFMIFVFICFLVVGWIWRNLEVNVLFLRLMVVVFQVGSVILWEVIQKRLNMKMGGKRWFFMVLQLKFIFVFNFF